MLNESDFSHRPALYGCARAVRGSCTLFSSLQHLLRSIESDGSPVAAADERARHALMFQCLSNMLPVHR